MKVAILAGGMGTRLQEETVTRPKPMVEIGGHPILWHIMQHYAKFQCKEFIIALGYKGDFIKDYFLNFYHRRSSLHIDLATGEIESNRHAVDDWAVSLIDTGIKTNTGGRIKRLREWVGNETFLLTYGDGVSNVDLDELLACHRHHGRLVTLTAVRPPARFGGLTFAGDRVTSFNEKPLNGEGWINGGFFVVEPQVLDRIVDDDRSFEHDVLEQLAKEDQLIGYQHNGFWQCMDNIRELHLLESLWQSGSPPWMDTVRAQSTGAVLPFRKRAA